MPCSGCDSTGQVQWTSPPHRDDPRFQYACGTCGGTGDEDHPSLVLTPKAVELLTNPPTGGNANWIR